MKHPGGRPRKEVTAADIPQQDYLTVQEAAAILGVHKHTVQARLRGGTLKGKKLGGVWRIYRDSLVNDKVAADPNIEGR
jgi:excisionase family DNA binding protein